ncbi:VOC family protein [Phytobacter sp. V91]|uniref:VOC family protein n=1 Tax=Phytobacter sp. V91 TaxID=3369425 RepID=UPI003F5FE281
MDISASGLDVLFIAGFGPIPRDVKASAAFYQATLGLPLKGMEGNEEYLVADHDALKGAKHFALWPLSQAAESCFGKEHWPADLPVPQSWIEFEVEDLSRATQHLQDQGYKLLVANRLEPWGQSISRLLSPEGMLVGLSITPWMRD